MSVNSVFGRTGDVVAQSGDYSLSQIGGVNLASPAKSQVLLYNGTNWTNQNLTVSVQAYGATGNGSTDDTTAIQNAITAVVNAGGGTVFFPPGNYKISSNLNVQGGARLVGAGWGENGMNSQGSNTAATTITWHGSTGGTMILIKSATSTYHIYDAAVIGLYLEGNFTAGVLVKASSTVLCEFDFAGEAAYGPNSSTYGYGLILDGANNALSFNNRVRKLLYNATANSDSIYTVGLLLDSAGFGTTVNFIDYVQVIDQVDGNGIWIRSDNNTIVHCQADLTFKNDPVYPGRNNYVFKCTGLVTAESMSHGNVVGAESESAIKINGIGTIGGVVVNNGGSGYTSAPTVTIGAPDNPGGAQATATATVSGGVLTAITMTNNGSGYTKNPSVTFSGGGGSSATATAITPTLHYQIVSFTNGGLFETAKYQMSGSKELSVNDFSALVGSPTHVNIASNSLAAWSMPKSSQVVASLPSQVNWNNGNIESVDIYYAVDTSPGSAQQISINTWLGSISSGESLTTANLQGSSITVPSGASTTNLNVYRVMYSTPVPLTLGDLLNVLIARASSDSYTGNFQLVGARVNYQSKGPYLGTPTSPTYGQTYNVAPMGC